MQCHDLISLNTFQTLFRILFYHNTPIIQKCLIIMNYLLKKSLFCERRWASKTNITSRSQETMNLSLSYTPELKHPPTCVITQWNVFVVVFNIYLTYFHTTQSKKEQPRKKTLYLRLKKKNVRIIVYSKKYVVVAYIWETQKKSKATHLVSRWYQRCKEV